MVPAYAAVKAVTDRTVLYVNESLTLEIIQTNSKSGKPDLSILEKDFTIMSQSQNQQFNIINGKSSSKRIWTVFLMPKKAGEIIIPAISLGKESSEPIALVVQKASPSSGAPLAGDIDSKDDIFIDVFVNPKEKVYVQQKIDLHIRIYFHNKIRLSNMSLAELVINDVIMEQTGEDKQYSKIINKQTYNVIERSYSLFPQKSGFLTIPAIRFEAIQGLSRNSNFGGFFGQRGKPVYEQSSPLQITVKKKPDNFIGNYWLPAESIQIISQHSELSDIKVGDSITLTDKIIAKGVLGSLIPSISWPKLKNLKTYPDKASINSQADKGNIYGLREEKMAIIPLHPGKYQLPDRKIIWWNTITDHQEEKIIPGISFIVSETENSNTTIENKYLPLQNKSPIQEIFNQDIDDEQSPSIINKTYTGYATTKQNPWFWAWLGTSLLLLILLVISLFFVFNKPNTTKKKNKTATNNTLNSQELLKKINKSCSKNNKSQTMKLLIQWANQYFNHNNDTFSNLNTLSLKINDNDLVAAIEELDQSLYSDHASDWDGNKLFNSLKNYLNKKKKAPDNKNLLPLNPLT